MKGKIVFTFKDKGDGVTGIKHKLLSEMSIRPR